MVTVLNQWVTATDRIDQVQLSFLHWLASEDQARADAYRDFREYYDGDHQTQLTDRLRRFLQIKSGEEFNINLCPIVVDALAEKLSVTGFDAGQDQSSIVWQWWQDNLLDLGQGEVHTGAVRDGDIYLLVDWENEEQRPRFTPEMAYDGAEGVKLHYDPEHRNVPAFASKRWRISQGEDAGKVRRMNLYYPDRIEKYISRGKGNEGQWREYVEDDAEWPLPWTASDGTPLGVPVVHFKNRGKGYNYGQSELKDVIPLQNALNKSLIDLLAAADTTAFRVFTMTGDDPGGMSIVPGSWIYSENPEVKIGAISGENLDSMIRVKDSVTIDVGRVSRTPLSYFQISGHRPAEGTLKAEETPLVSKARNRQVSYGASWAGTMRMARRLHNAFGPGGLDEEQVIETIWRDPESRNEKAHLEALKLKAELGVPIERLWEEMGYDQDSIDKMRALRGEEMQASSNLGGGLLAAFEGGR